MNMNKSIIEKMRSTASEIKCFISDAVNLRAIYEDLSNEELLFIAKNKIYADNIRYQNKNDLNESLATPDLIDIKIRQIKKMFDNGTDEGCLRFLTSLLNDIKFLEQTYIWGAFAFDETEESCLAVWEQAYSISTIDNASAMCFASDTWEFYIFELILQKLSDAYPPENPFDFGMLTAGLKDVRTKAYENKIYVDNQDDINKILSENNVINSDGIMPLFLLTSKPVEVLNRQQSSPLHKTGFSDEFLYWFEVYSIFYECKILYETFEYFGKYEFLRHFAIMKTFNILNSKNSKKAQEFKYLASTYQYDRVIKILKNRGE